MSDDILKINYGEYVLNLKQELAESRAAFNVLNESLAKANAECAVFRATLEWYASINNHVYGGSSHTNVEEDEGQRAQEALSSTAGSTLLKAVREAIEGMCDIQCRCCSDCCNVYEDMEKHITALKEALGENNGTV